MTKATTTAKPLSGRLVWNKAHHPILNWTVDGQERIVTLSPTDMSPALRESVAAEIPVSFEIANGAPIHIRKAGDNWRVLASVLGGSPAVITETLQELLRRVPPFVPDRIVIFTTTFGERGLDSKFDANLRALCAEYGVAVPDYQPVELLREAAGTPLPDIRSDSDNVAAANVIANRIRELARHPESVIHASVAGGRKTMGTLLSDAMCLFGRGSDAVSHVLVQPEAVEQRVRNFYYRPLVSFPLLDGSNNPVLDGGRPLTSNDVRLDLANKPFFRLRGLVDEPLLADTKTAIDFAEVTAAVNVTINPPQLIIHPLATGEIEIAGFKRVKLDPTHYALFRVVAEATAGRLSGIEGDGALTLGDFQSNARVPDPPEKEADVYAGLRPVARRYLDILRRLRFPGETWAAFRASEFWRLGRRPGTGVALWRNAGSDRAHGYLNPAITNLNKALAAEFGSRAAELYQVDRVESDPLRIRLACAPSLIELRA